MSTGIRDTYLTKILKLLYILDEFSVRETGTPFTMQEYKVWRFGPVPEEVYQCLKDTSKSKVTPFSDYLAVTSGASQRGTPTESFKIEPKAEFSDDEFSDYDIDLMDRVLNKYGEKSAAELVGILHKEGSLWDKRVACGIKL